MLFDLRGRGRRRAIQVIYLGLAVLMGGGLILFGIGGNTSGGLFDAFKSNSSGTNADDAFTKRLDGFEERVKANPQDAAALAAIAKLHFQLATTGTNYDQTTQKFTKDGEGELRESADAWKRYLALNPSKPDADTATLMVQALGQGGLKRYPDAVQALEIAMVGRKPSAALYSQLAILAAAAKQDRKSELAAQKAVSLAPKDQRKIVQQQIDQAKQQLTNPQGAAGQQQQVPVPTG